MVPIGQDITSWKWKYPVIAIQPVAGPPAAPKQSSPA
jgi:hypothetical protein